MALFWESRPNITTELRSFSAGTDDGQAFAINGETDSFRGGFKLTSYAEVAALMDACRRHLATRVTISPVEWEPHPEFADWDIADHRGYRLVVTPRAYTIYQEEKMVVSGASTRPKQHVLESLEQNRPVARDAYQFDGWEDITLQRLKDLSVDASARWLARNPRHKLAAGLAATLEELKDATTAANAVEIVRALRHRKAMVLSLARDVPVDAA
jgi:hypothetical protein